jgi:hypothetical protein
MILVETMSKIYDCSSADQLAYDIFKLHSTHAYVIFIRVPVISAWGEELHII